MEKQKSWTCTCAVQVFLCVILYLSLNLAQPRNNSLKNRSGSSRHLDDVYFITVRGGFRPHQQQIHLLKQMENVAGLYNVSFVVNISDLGEDDSLMMNASEVFLSLNVPWYSTRSLKGDGVNLTKKIEITRGKTLNILGVDSETLHDLVLAESTTGSAIFRSNRLIQMLEAAAGNWIVAVGYDPVIRCEENTQDMEAKLVHEPIHHIFTNYGVNAYVSRGSCTFASQAGVSYIGLPDPDNIELNMPSLNARQVLQSVMEEMTDGFLLHRVNSLQMTSYFVSSAGEIANKHQMGREVM